MKQLLCLLVPHPLSGPLRKGNRMRYISDANHDFFSKVFLCGEYENQIR